MRLDHINPIVDSAITVLAEFTGSPVNRGDMKLRRRPSTSRDVATIIRLKGNVDGRIIIEMDGSTALAMAGLMNNDLFRELDRLALDTLMELANIIVARAVSSLNELEFALRLAPPLIFTGTNVSCFSSLDTETLVVPLHTNVGDMNLSLALRMKTL
ncbi:MAG TPA: chemotaxis protein CheX [Nitrospirota bacterium]|nr:chemotaxis protein CheX [Nitrospirota bacterium]